MDESNNLIDLIMVYLSSMFCFLVSFSITIYLNRKKSKESHHSPEVLLIHQSIRLLRLLCVLLLLLQLPLFFSSSTLNVTIFGSIVRPIANSIAISSGFITNTHAVLRWVFGIAMLVLIAFDTVSEAYNYADILCFRLGKPCYSISFDLLTIESARQRDLASIFVELWCLLLDSYLSIAIGIFHNHYSIRVLSTSRAHHMNIREVLAKQHNIL